MTLSTEWVVIIMLVLVGVAAAVYFFFFANKASADAPPSCAELEAQLLAEVNKPNGGDVATISAIRNQLNLNCQKPTASQGPVTNTSTGEVFLPYSIETECSALVTSYMSEFKQIQVVKNDPTQKSAKATHMRVLLGDIRTCYQDKLATVDETTVNGLISSVEKAITQITSTKPCFKDGECKDDAWVVHGDNFINNDINPTLDALKEILGFAKQRRTDLMRALAPNVTAPSRPAVAA